MDMNWGAIINKEYENVNIEKERKIRDIWKSNRVFLNSQTDVKRNNDWTLEKGECDAKKFHVKHYNAKTEKHNIVQVQSFTLPTATPTPLNKAWVSIPRNFVSKDSVELVSQPFLGDHFSGASDDDLFVNLVRELSLYQNDNNPMLESTSTQVTVRSDNVNQREKEVPFPDPEIFENISSYFNGNYSIDKYIKLTKINIKQCESHIDSYRKLLCRRCFIYNCQLHSDDIGMSNLKKHFEELRPTTVPCSNTCYLIMKGKTKVLTREIEDSSAAAESQNNTSDSIGSATSETMISNNEWNISDQSMLLALLKVFPDNCCAIAQAMLKSCNQIHSKIQSTEIVHDSVKATVTKRGKIKQKIKYHEDRVKHLTKTYKPCVHEGLCYKNFNCLCVDCEKFCSCGSECRKRAPKCICKSSCTTRKCVCHDSLRECDPDRCECVSCKNDGIQRNQEKKLQIVSSPIHGWGIVIKESCQKNEYIGEYRGEIISCEESERRGKEYAKQKWNSLFTLNGETVVDGIRYGSKLRFVNFSKKPNCYTLVKMVNGDHRIGFYALRFIKAGEELTFDYNTYDPTQ